MYLCRNHDWFTQNIPQTLLWDILCQDYCLTYIKHGLKIIFCNRVMILGQIHYCWGFKMYVWDCEHLEHHLKGRNLYSWSKTRQLTPKLSRLIQTSTGTRKNMYFVPLRTTSSKWISTLRGVLHYFKALSCRRFLHVNVFFYVFIWVYVECCIKSWIFSLMAQKKIMILLLH